MGASSATRAVLIVWMLLAMVAGAIPVDRVHAAGPVPAASYRLEASVDLDKATVGVTERVALRNVVGVPLDTLVFHVVANTIGAVSHNTHLLRFLTSALP